MEEVFNYLYSDVHSSKPPVDCLDAYWALVQMYAAAIARTTNTYYGKSRYGVGSLLRNIVKKDPMGEITFITFNQDLIIEKSIQYSRSHKSYKSIPWNIKMTYEIPFSKTMGDKTFRQFKSRGSASMKILKLHGSLNWVYAVRSGKDPKNSIRNPLGKNLVCLNSNHIYGKLRIRIRKKYKSVVPLIIPPIYEKASRFQRIIGPLWEKAAKTIENADRVVIFGYSFPDTDFAAHSLFRRSFYQNSKLKEISVINPNPAILAKVSGILNATVGHHYADVPLYVKTL